MYSLVNMEYNFLQRKGIPERNKESVFSEKKHQDALLRHQCWPFGQEMVQSLANFLPRWSPDHMGDRLRFDLVSSRRLADDEK